ncbi:MAG TPA: 5-oxoprolinase subunit PxpB [Flavobacteriaceae bacterium]|nr:5-oxoprolinase subunit PxpB [Flavobacteriaceae bacterium]
MKQPEVKFYGEKAVLLQWEHLISIEVHQQVVSWQMHIEKHFSDEIEEVIPAYNSLLVILQDKISKEHIVNLLKNTNLSVNTLNKPTTTFIIPVCYKGSFAPDLNVVAESSGLSAEEVVRLHTSKVYTVFFIGFLPGFPYLGRLDNRLHTPRKATPRKNIPKGSVAIGGSQTGIYTIDSPGGWNIIGKSPLSFFKVDRSQPFLFKAGDKIAFEAIDTEEFYNISDSITAKTYCIRKE